MLRTSNGCCSTCSPWTASVYWCASRTSASKKPRSLTVDQVLADARKDGVVDVGCPVGREVHLDANGQSEVWGPGVGRRLLHDDRGAVLNLRGGRDLLGSLLGRGLGSLRGGRGGCSDRLHLSVPGECSEGLKGLCLARSDKFRGLVS